MTIRQTRFQFRITIVIAILVVVVAMSLMAGAVVYTVARAGARDAAERQFTVVTDAARREFDALLAEAAVLADTIAGARDVLEVPRGDGLAHPARTLLTTALLSQADIYSVYVGYDDGSFLQLINTRGDPTVITAHRAPTATRLIVRAITQAPGSVRTEYWTFLDVDGQIIGGRAVEEPAYDPRTRPWYGDATRSRATFTDPYLFASLGELGITASRALTVYAGVVGVDITISTLQDFVTETAVGEGGGIIISDATDRTLAATPGLLTAVAGREDLARLERVPREVSALDSGLVSLDGQELLVGRESWERGDRRWTATVIAPLSAFDRTFRALQSRLLISALIVLAIAVPLVLWFARGLTSVLSELAEEANRVARLDFTPGRPIHTRIEEFSQLSEGFRVMKETLASRDGELSTSLERLQTIIELNIAMSAENDINRLAELILGGARVLSHADGGSLYLVDEKRRTLEFMIVLNESLGFQQGGTSAQSVTLRPVALYDDSGEENHHNVVTHCFHTGETINIPDAYNSTGFDFSGTRAFDESNNYRSASFLTVPLKPRGAGIIGALQLINATDPQTGEIVAFSGEIQRFVEALTAGAATALYNRDLIEQQKRLFDAMIKLIAGAIDAKSPYTGGHCARVPVIAMMLTDEVERSEDPRYDSFELTSADERRAFWTGAWLHDAGKVTTPDFVVDKATKLETIYNRIHEVRTRFELLLRDAHIAMLEAVQAGTDPQAARAQFREEATRLREEFAFVAECNLGGEFLSDDKVAELRRIGQRRWLRHFDDRLGLSWEELQRYPELADDDAADLDAPVEESLLADKAEHVVPRGPEYEALYGPYQFALQVPENLYNRGELYNLSIGRGTLSPEERFKINEHVMQTIVMLDGLPFPEDLKRVPEYAGTHHEALNGSGYPRALSAEELSVPARIMAIADIFEALTASDRPYKKAKPLSVAVKILYNFKREGHIDPDLFDLFLTSGAYRRYAERYLRPDQIDDFDITPYLG